MSPQGTTAGVVPRNAPCPCGSGRRYKDCHGSLVLPASDDALDEIRERLQQGDVTGAAKACADALRDRPSDPLVLELVAECEIASGQPRQAVALLLQAVRSLDGVDVPPMTVFRLWSGLNAAFIDALAGLEPIVANDRRERYRQWTGQRSHDAHSEPVSVVLLVASDATADDVMPTVRSIAAQTRAPAELVVVSLGPAAALATLRARADLFPFDLRWVDAASKSKAAAYDAGIAASSARWLVVAEPPHAFASRHLEALFGGIESAGAQWGFTDCELVAGTGSSAAQLGAARVSLDATHTTLAKVDSVGHAFIDQTFAAVGSGAVGFSRALHTAIGGFRPFAFHELWDFALRATLQDEPVHVVAATYRHAIGPHEQPQTQADREATQLAMFRDFYARTCTDASAGPNPFAPSLAGWGLAFARRIFQSGHVLMLDLATLEDLRARMAAATVDAPARLSPGLNLIGFAFGEFGLAEALRGLARGCEAGGIPFVVNDIEMRLNTRQADRRMAAHLSTQLRHGVSVMCVNPDMLAMARPLLERTRDAGGRRIGYWFWELETIPSSWEDAFDAVDELWCASEFVATALRNATAKPVIKVPPALEVRLQRSYRRAEFRLPEHCFLFLFTFDYNSFVARKNPEAAIRAFRAAFPKGRGDVGLVVKSVNGVHRPDRVAAIAALIGDDPRVHHLDTFLDRDASYGLISVCDAYVSLHRAEGLGLGLAEAMALRKPTIATGYSGNLEFMDVSNSLLVGHRLVKIAPGEYTVDDPRFFWAEPDVDDAAQQMRRLADDAALRERLAAAGRAEIEARFGRARSAASLRARLAALGIELE